MLVLNGDIEKLQRFRLAAVRARWASLYRLFGRFAERSALYKIVGNHDEGIRANPGEEGWPLYDAIRCSFDGNSLFLFHGHQATIFFERFNWLAEILLRYGANPLRIANYPVMYESRKRYVTEHRVYAFSSSRRILSVIGHTHRPLFESLSKIDTLKFRIEKLCRDYPTASARVRRAIETAVASYKAELERLWEKDPEDGQRDSLYDDRHLIPCLFNSGCTIGKRGITAIEVADGTIALVHWFDSARSSRYLSSDGSAAAERLGETGFYRTVIKRDQLAYIFSRIRLLA
jgi:predicted phosphodiesterase